MIDDAMLLSLRKAGIGKRFHHRKLSEFAEMKDVADGLFTGRAQAALKEGKGWTIEGASGRAREAFMVLARSTHLTGTGVLVTDLIDLNKTLEEDELSRQVLFVAGFYEPGPPVFTPYQARMAARTMAEWMEEGGVIVPLVTPGDWSEWWPGYLVDAIEQRNTRIKVRQA